MFLFKLKYDELNLKQELANLNKECKALKSKIGILGNDKLMGDYTETLRSIDKLQKKYALGGRHTNPVDKILKAKFEQKSWKFYNSFLQIKLINIKLKNVFSFGQF